MYVFFLQFTSPVSYTHLDLFVQKNRGEWSNHLGFIPVSYTHLDVYKRQGKVIPLQEIHDEVFASGSMGEGIAILPEDNKICSPVKGTVSFLFPTAHAIGIQSEDGAEILIHIGIDSVSYTHLDVYKRQPYGSGEESRAAAS